MRPLRVGAVALSLAAFFAGCGDPAPNEPIAESAAALSANDKTAYDYFIGQGLSGVQAAGILGNLDIESGMDPTSVESGGPGRGIAQWSAGGRWDTTPSDNVIDYATTKGEDHLSLNLQLEFIWYELTTFSDYGLAKLRAATTVSDAVDAFESGYEGCGACDSSSRVTDAQNALAAYGGDVPSDAGATEIDSGGPACVVTSSGKSGQCIAVSACDALGDHTSTPGFCPGAADIECCTPNAGASGSGGNGGSDGSSSTGNGNAGSGATSDSGGCNTGSRVPSSHAAIFLLLVALGLSRRPRCSRSP